MRLYKMGYFFLINSLQGDRKHLRRSEHTIYTDGSSTMDNKVGNSFVVYHKNEIIHTQSTRLPDGATVFQAEVNDAILEAGDYILQLMHNRKIRYIKILSDSPAALLAFKRVEINSTLVKEAMNTWEALSSEIDVSIGWVKKHILEYRVMRQQMRQQKPGPFYQR